MFGPSCPTTTKILKDVTIQAFWDVMPYLLDVSKDRRSAFNSAWLHVLKMKAVLSFETSVSIHQSTRIVPSHKTWIFNTTVTASNLDKRWEIVLPIISLQPRDRGISLRFPFFRGGVYCRGLWGTRSLNMNTCPISPQSPAGASKDVMSCVFGFMEFLKWWRKCGE